MRTGALGKALPDLRIGLPPIAQKVTQSEFRRGRSRGVFEKGSTRVDDRCARRSFDTAIVGLSRQSEDKREGYGVCAADWAASRLLAIRNAGRRARNPGVRG